MNPAQPCSSRPPLTEARGGITTTDLVGAPGDAPGDYTSGFGGTSAATPLVGGIAALMLAENPSLTWRDVQHILAHSAVRINPADSGWTTGSFAHNERFGFGLADGQAAVNLAATWSPVPAESAVPAVTRSIGRAIPDDDTAGLVDSISIDNAFINFTVEHVEVIFDATHPYRGDLEATLTSPAGVISRLATVRALDAGENFSFWRFGSVRHWGNRRPVPGRFGLLIWLPRMSGPGTVGASEYTASRARRRLELQPPVCLLESGV
ncbi:MAG: proprotein convertase P-domain-containing protein [Candidatus Methylomirabilis sp.]|nr:proprotein convertase P-domain-containing protein [Candidatus Methylomirabilis sp.]